METTIEDLAVQDFEVASAWLSDPAISKWLGSEWRNRQVTPVVLTMAVRNKRNRFFLVRHDGHACGIVALADIDPPDSTAMIWYVLGDSRLTGRGVTSAAVQRLTRIAFDELLLSSLYAWTMADNLASQRVLTKAGFQEAGRIRHATCSAGRQVDRLYFDIVSRSH